MKLPRGTNQRICKLYRRFTWRLMGKIILLLTTTRRSSGLPRTTPVQYEKRNGIYYIGSSNGPNSDWVRNINANPNVSLAVGKNVNEGVATLIQDSERIADFLSYRLKRHPVIIRLILKLDGLSFHPGR